MALQPNSPAKDFGTTIGAPPTDQRGSIRPFGPGADIGSYEEGPPPLQLTATRNGSTVELSFYAEAGSDLSTPTLNKPDVVANLRNNRASGGRRCDFTNHPHDRHVHALQTGQIKKPAV
jgi:hypothetical protein